MNVIKVKNLTIAYKKRPAIKGINLNIEEGNIIGIIGPNGAGKSTLLKGILGLLPIETGEVKIFDKPVKESKAGIYSAEGAVRLGLSDQCFRSGYDGKISASEYAWKT